MLKKIKEFFVKNKDYIINFILKYILKYNKKD